MIRPLLCLLLGGCTTAIEVAPIIDAKTNALSCCVAYIESSKNADGSIQITKPAANFQIKLGIRFKF